MPTTPTASVEWVESQSPAGGDAAISGIVIPMIMTTGSGPCRLGGVDEVPRRFADAVLAGDSLC